MPFASEKLQLVVREAYLELRRQPRPEPLQLSSVVFEPPQSLLLTSKMADARLYLDGPYRQVPVGLGDRVVCSISDEPLTVFGLGRRRGAPVVAVTGRAARTAVPAKPQRPRKKVRRLPV